MEYSLEHQESVQHKFDAFCKIVVKNEMRTHYREKEQQRKREVMFSEMSEAEFSELATSDEYPAEDWFFCVAGRRIPVKDNSIADALNALTAIRRDIVLMHFYLGMNNREIGEILHWPQSNVSYHKIRAIKLMREYMEGWSDA